MKEGREGKREGRWERVGSELINVNALGQIHTPTHTHSNTHTQKERLTDSQASLRGGDTF
jgi:hypothetical protein